MIVVHGLLGEPSPELRAAASVADVVVAGRRHLAALGVPGERQLVLGALSEAMEQVSRMPPEAHAIVVASGDPLFFGIVRRLRGMGLQPTVVTAPSSVASAFAAVGLPWEDAEVVSVHGRPLIPALNVARANPKVAVFTSAEHGIRQLAGGLAGLSRWYVLAERMGERDECVRVLSEADALVAEPAEPNVVLVLAERPEDMHQPWAGWLARPDRPERPTVSVPAAVAFARLLPEPGELLLAYGPLADEVAALARWAGAACILGEINAGAGERADVVLAPDARAIDAILPRAVVLTGATSALPTQYEWSAEAIGEQVLTMGVLTGSDR